MHPGGTDQHFFDPEGNWLGNAGSYSLVPFGGRYFALYLGGNTLFNHVNALDSASMRTNQSGAVAEDILFYPWGDVWEVQGSGGYNFANMPYRDVTTTTDITTARFYSPNFGRWFSPDPAGKGAVQLDDPQTWNMYAYVRNSPATLTDPNGDYYCDPDYATIDKNGTMTVHGGACHLEASDLFWLTNSSGLYSPSAGSPGSSPSGQEAPVSPTPGPSPMNIAPCVAGSVAAGAVVGGVAGALLGGTFATAGGPELTIPGGAAGAEEGTLAGAAVGGAVGSILCSQGSGAGGGGAGGGGGNVRQNRQANDARRQAARETGKSWTRELEEKFHNEITKQGINDYHELVQIAKEVLQGYR